jgi:integration host factor alpha subunit
MTLTKAELADLLFEQLGLNKREAKDMVERFFEEIRTSLEAGDSVKLSGFGNFQLREKPQRPGRNPKTGEEQTMPEASRVKVDLPPIPAKRYFTIGEVSDLCAVKPHVLRYWEQEFTQLKPVKRRGNRRYYQHHEVLLIRRIRDLLYEQGFTINGARHRLEAEAFEPRTAARAEPATTMAMPANEPASLRAELEAIRELLKPGPGEL